MHVGLTSLASPVRIRYIHFTFLSRPALMIELKIGKSSLTLTQGDITKEDVAAIVNAANSSLMGGGGVDGAIHRAAGPQLHEECKAIVARQGECPTGEAVITSGGNLKAQHVIHAVGPVWHGGARDEERLLKSAYVNSLMLAIDHNLSSIAFPSISTGIYDFPIEQAATIAFNAAKDFLKNHQQIREVRFVTFSEHDYAVYRPLFESSE